MYVDQASVRSTTLILVLVTHTHTHTHTHTLPGAEINLHLDTSNLLKTDDKCTHTYMYTYHCMPGGSRTSSTKHVKKIHSILRCVPGRKNVLNKWCASNSNMCLITNRRLLWYYTNAPRGLSLLHIKGHSQDFYSLGCVPHSKCNNSQCSIAPDYGYKRWSTDSEAPRVYTQPEGIGYLVGTALVVGQTL